MSQSTQTYPDFGSLCAAAAVCTSCAATLCPNPILNEDSGPVTATVMLVGEAPGRLGAARSHIPFHGDESGKRLDWLIASAGWRRDDIFITNAILCNPTDDRGRNRTPRMAEIEECRGWLLEQLRLVDPLLVVALGATALKALHRIQPHELSLRDSQSEPAPWHGRYLAARYHPSARAATHRPVEQQHADFEVLGNWLRKPGLNDGNAGGR